MNKYENIKEIFAEKLNELMDENKLKGKSLSEKTGIPRTTISSWLTMKKKISIDYLCLVADFFGVTTEYLLGREK